MLSVEARLSGLVFRWAERQRLGDPISPEDLCGDCPELLQELKGLIGALEAVDLALETDTGSAASGPPERLSSSLPPMSRTVEGYEILGELGRGGMGIVYRAYDRSRRRVVALKTVRRADSSSLYRFKQEFRSLADVAHPNLVSLYQLVSDGRDWFIAMELVEGVDFLAYVRAGGGGSPDFGRAADVSGGPAPLQDGPAPAEAIGIPIVEPAVGDGMGRSRRDPATWKVSPAQSGRLRQALGQLAEGLTALHDAGRLHRDIKPSNVLVDGGGRAVLLDFGLAVETESTGLHQSSELHVLGTVAYMAPEQAAGMPVSPAADWYSVGVMLFEALTGRLPFVGRSLEVLVDKQRSEPPAPRELAEDLPEDLDALCVDLIRRDPGKRPDGREVLRRLGRTSDPRGGLGVATSSPRRGLTLVGRDGHLAALKDAFAAATAGNAVTVHIRGRSGSGKSALLQHFLDQLGGRDEAVVLSGRCYERESVPFKALDSLIDALSRYLKRLPAPEVKEVLPRDVSSLTRVFPVLRRVEALAAAPSRATVAADPQELRRRAFASLRELLARLGDRRPLVLAIDDLQWGDLDSAELLSEILRPPDPPVLLLIGSYRSEDAECSPFLRRLLASRAEQGSSVDHRDLAVEALDAAESETLAAMLLGGSVCEEGTHINRIIGEAEGNPFFLAELVRYIQAGAAPAGLPTPGDNVTLERVLMGRVLGMPEDARRFLEVVAVSGRPLGRADACRAAGLEAGDFAAFGALRAGRLIRASGPAELDLVETYHDRVRETVVAHLDAATLRRHHRLLAEVLEASGRTDPEVLALHFHEAGDPAAASGYYASAADRASQALAFDRAATLYRQALDLGTAGDADRRPLIIKLADSLANAGLGAEAAEKYLEAAEVSPAVAAIDLRRRAAEQFLIGGHVDEGLAALRDVLQGVGIPFPTTPRRALASILLRRARLRLRGLGFRPRNPGQIAAADLTRIDTCWSAAVGLSNIDVIRGADFQALGLLLSLKAGDPFRIARAVVLEAVHASTARPGRGRPKKLFQAAERLVRQVDDPYTTGLLWLSQGVVAYLDSRLQAAHQLLSRCEEILGAHSPASVWEIDTARIYSLWSLADMGEVAELARRHSDLLREARKRGNLYAEANMRTYSMPIIRLAADEADEADRELQDIMTRWSQRGYQLQHKNALVARVMIELYRGAGVRAWEAVRNDWASYESSYLNNVQVNMIHMTQIRGRSAIAASLTSDDPRPLLRVAEADARRLERERATCSAALASVIRAGVAGSRGDGAAARTHLSAAADGLEALDMRLWAWAARRRLGELIGGDGGRELVGRADAWMARQTIRNPARMTAMLVPGFPDC